MEEKSTLLRHTVLEGDRITLVPFAEKFITDTYLSWLRDPEVGKFLEKPAIDLTMEAARLFCQEMMKSENNCLFAITLRESGQHIGNTRLGPVNWDTGFTNFGLMVGDKSMHGQGIGQQVMELINTFCFETLGLSRLAFCAFCDNPASIRLYEKCGFRTEMLGEQLDRKGVALDIVTMSMTPDEYFSQQKKL